MYIKCPHQGRVIANEIDTEVARLNDALDRFSHKMDEIIRERESRRDPRDTEITQLRAQIANLHAYNEGRDKMLADMTAEVDRLRELTAAVRALQEHWEEGGSEIGRYIRALP